MQSQGEHKKLFHRFQLNIMHKKINFYPSYLKFKVETFVNILAAKDTDVSEFDLSWIGNSLTCSLDQKEKKKRELLPIWCVSKDA